MSQKYNIKHLLDSNLIYHIHAQYAIQQFVHL